MKYRRAKTKGGTYFFTVVAYKRKKIFCDLENIELLHSAFKHVMVRHPFVIDAFVLLPDHLHCIWTLNEGDYDFSTKWRLIKSYFTKNCDKLCNPNRSASQHEKKEQALWQRRYWEHKIHDEKDYSNHVEYIHYNPVKHGLVKAAKDWQFSSFSRYVKSGLYASNWGINDEIEIPAKIGME